MKINDLVKEINNLMLNYEREIENTKSKYLSDKENVQSSINQIKSGSLDEAISKDYIKIADILDKVMNDLHRVQGSYVLDDFDLDAKFAMASIKPRKELNLKKNTDDWALKIQEEAVNVMEKLATCSSYNAMLPLLKELYQVHVDAKYLRENSISLLKSSGLYDSTINNSLEAYNQKLNNIDDEYKESQKLENMEVYPKMKSLKGELENIRANNTEFRMQNGEIEFGNGYDDSFLLGTQQRAPIAKEISSFSKKFLKDDLQGLNVEKIYWKLDANHSSIIIDLPENVMSDRKASNFYEYIEQLLFTFITGLPEKKVKISAIDCPSPSKSISSPFTPIIKRAEKYLGQVIMHSEVVTDKTKVEDLIKSLYQESRKRSDDYCTDGYDNIFAYNESIVDNQHYFNLLLVNNYPYGFENEEVIDQLKNLVDDKDTGIITIIFQSNNKETYTKKRNDYGSSETYQYLDYKEFGADYFTNFDFQEKTFTYNGVKTSFALTVPNFNNITYWEDIKRGYESTKILFIDSLIKQVEAKNPSSSSAYSPLSNKFYDYKLEIPIGKENADIYNFKIDMKVSPSSIFLGSTGSGKTSLLHVLILSAAYFYSPKELNICLVDFKGKDSSTEFNMYKKGGELYIPHVNYLSLKSTAENALDMLDMIESMHGERMKLLSKNNVEDIVQYNNLPAIKGNPDRIIPRVIFVIDEYNTMMMGGVEGDDTSMVSDTIATKLFTLLTRIRSTGISILLSGHSTEGLNEKHMNNIRTRVALAGYKGQLFDLKYDETDNDKSILSEKGKSIISTDLGTSKRIVSLAYAGGTSSSRQLALAKLIRQKCERFGSSFPQTVAGSTDVVPITSMRNLKDIIKNDESLDKYSYLAYMGVTSTSSVPVAVRFTSEETALNYLMTGESRSIAIYERNLILGFTYMQKVRNILTSSPSISYIRISSSLRDNVNEITPYLEYKQIKNNVNVIELEKDACNEILNIHSVFKNREKKKTNNRDPYLLVVHNVSWIKKESWLDEETSKVEQNTSNLMDLSSMSVEEIIAMEQNGTNEVTTTSEITFDEITGDQVQDALKELYAEGYKYNIFVVLSSSIATDFEDYINFANREKAPLANTIADSQAFYSIKDKYGSTCCHIKSSKQKLDDDNHTVLTDFISSKVRLFDYSLNTEKEFLKELGGNK